MLITEEFAGSWSGSSYNPLPNPTPANPFAVPSPPPPQPAPDYTLTPDPWQAPPFSPPPSEQPYEPGGYYQPPSTYYEEPPAYQSPGSYYDPYDPYGSVAPGFAQPVYGYDDHDPYAQSGGYTPVASYGNEPWLGGMEATITQAQQAGVASPVMFEDQSLGYDMFRYGQEPIAGTLPPNLDLDYTYQPWDLAENVTGPFDLSPLETENNLRSTFYADQRQDAIEQGGYELRGADTEYWAEPVVDPMSSYFMPTAEDYNGRVRGGGEWGTLQDERQIQNQYLLGLDEHQRDDAMRAFTDTDIQQALTPSTTADVSWGEVLRGSVTSALPPGTFDFLPNPSWLPLQDAAEGFTSPVGVVTAPLALIGAGGATGVTMALRMLAFEASQELVSAAAPRLAADYGPDWMEHPAAQLTLGIGAGLAAGLSASALVQGGVPATAVAKGAQLAEEVAPSIDTTPVPEGALRWEGDVATGTKATDEFGSGLGAGFQPGGATVTDVTRDSIVGRAVAKVAPGGIQPSIRGIEPETATRTGNIIQLSNLEPGYTVTDVTNGVARQADRQVSNFTEVIAAEAAPEWKALGRIGKGKDGNWYARDIVRSEVEQRLGLEGALLARVLERPDEYIMSARQRLAIDRITKVADDVAGERELFGAPVNKLALEDDERFFWRIATKDTAGESLNPRRGPGGQRLSVPKDASRRFEDAAEGVAAGVVYADPRKVLPTKVQSGLQTAANAHVVNLLKPLGETWGARVNPELKAKLEGLRSELQSLKGTKGRLDDRTAKAVDDFLNAGPDADLDALRAALDQRVQRTPGGGIGKNFGKNSPQVRTAIRRTQRQIDRLLPEWRTARQEAMQTPKGRKGVSKDNVPALIGTDFPDVQPGPKFIPGAFRPGSVASRINSYYSRGVLPENSLGRGVKAINVANRFLIPINAIGDASATLNQLAIMLANKPVQFAKNFAIVSGRDMWRNTPYQKWLASPETQEAAKYITLLDEAGKNLASDFTFMGFAAKLPVLKQFQKHFTRFTNRMRVDAFNSTKDLYARQGKPLDAGGLEQAGKSIDRLTGISVSRAGDLEQLALFAPNWLRSQLEVVAKGVADGSLEGQVVRQYMKNYLTLGMTLVAGIALSQGRDLKEVLTPFEMDDGRIKLNPNFLTIRVGGQDVAVFGAYDSLARLAVVAGDAVSGAIQERDATELFDFIGYAASTKGSPVVKLIADMIKGETFTGGDPLDPKELLKRTLPFTAQGIVEGFQKGQDLETIAKDAGLTFLGAKSNPMSMFERLTEAAGKDFFTLTDEERAAVFEANPELAKEYDDWEQDRVDEGTEVQSSPEALAEQFANSDKIKAKYVTQQEADDKALAAGDLSGADWRANRKVRQGAKRGEMEANWRFLQDKPPEEWTVSDRYFNFVKSMTTENGQDVDWEAVDQWVAALTPEEQKELDSKLGTGGTATEKQYFAALEKLDTSGFFDAQSRIAFVRLNPEVVDDLKKWGLSEATVKVYTVEKEKMSQQAADDERLASGALSPEDWRENLKLREAELRGAKDLAYLDVSGVEREEMADSAVERYFAQVEQSVLPTGEVDWAAVEAWTAQQPPADQQAIENRPRFYLSPVVEEYKQTTQALGDSGYFDMFETAYQQIRAGRSDLQPWATFDALQTAAVQQFVANGATYDQALNQFRDSDLYGEVSELKNGSTVENAWMQNNPDLAVRAWEFGYLTNPTKAQLEWLIARRAEGYGQ